MPIGASGGIGWRESSTLFDMLIPSAEWETRGARFESMLMQSLGEKSEAMKLLRGYIRSLERNGLTTFGNDPTNVRRHIIDLMVLAATSHGPVGESSLSAVAAAHLQAKLSLSKVAQTTRISTRYVQHLLKTSGTSFTAHLAELRLNHAFKIALQAGVSDVSYFNRLFRSRFGCTPSDVAISAFRPTL